MLECFVHHLWELEDLCLFVCLFVYLFTFPLEILTAGSQTQTGSGMHEAAPNGYSPATPAGQYSQDEEAPSLHDQGQMEIAHLSGNSAQYHCFGS